MTKIMMFNIDEPKARMIESVCLPLGIITEQINKRRFGLPIGTLAAGCSPFASASEQDDFSEEMLVFSEFTSDLLDSFLKAFRERNIPPVALKAVVTEYNGGWSARALCEELKKEHSFIQSKKKEL